MYGANAEMPRVHVTHDVKRWLQFHSFFSLTAQIIELKMKIMVLLKPKKLKRTKYVQRRETDGKIAMK